MALMSALLELQKHSSQNGEAGILKTARSGIKSMAIAHEVLYQNESFSDLSMKKYIQHISDLTHQPVIYKDVVYRAQV